MNSRGFTFIELLVVISIISVLSSIALMSVNKAIVLADGKAEGVRARQYVYAIEQYINDTGKFPTLSPPNQSSSACLGSSVVCVDYDGFLIDYHDPLLENIVSSYAPNIDDVNKKEVRILASPPSGYWIFKSAYYMCDLFNDDGSVCLQTAMYWVVKGMDCGVPGSEGSYIAFANVKYCSYYWQ